MVSGPASSLPMGIALGVPTAGLHRIQNSMQNGMHGSPDLLKEREERDGALAPAVKPYLGVMLVQVAPPSPDRRGEPTAGYPVGSSFVRSLSQGRRAEPLTPDKAATFSFSTLSRAQALPNRRERAKSSRML